MRGKPEASIGLTYDLGADTEGFSSLLQEMRNRAGLTIGALSAKLDMRPGSMYQYFYKKRGVGDRVRCGGFCGMLKRVGAK